MSQEGPYWIDPGEISLEFPDVSLALREPDGLLAIGGDLSPERILYAYRHGIFPWYSDGQPILWWSPDPRTVLVPEKLKISTSLRKKLRSRRFSVTIDSAFAQVIRRCAEPRPGAGGTWITGEMEAAYIRLHQLGHAHSVETWLDERLVGGLYGVSIGKVFFGESMFSRESDASKIAFAHLVRRVKSRGVSLIDCQVYTAHLASLGAEEIPRQSFVRQLEVLCDAGLDSEAWTADPGISREDW